MENPVQPEPTSAAAAPTAQIVPVTPIAGNAKSTKRQPGPACSPAEWLKEIQWPFSAAHLEQVCSGQVFTLLLAITEGPEAIRSARYLVKNPDEMLAAGITRLEWLVGLSEELAKQHSSSKAAKVADPVGDYRIRLAEVLTTKFGKPFFKIATKHGNEKKINSLHFASLFAYCCGIEFDDKVGCFYRYNRDAGAWQPISEDRAREILIDFTVPFMHRKPLTYSNTPAFQALILEQARATNIHQDFMPDGYMFATQNKTLFLDTSGPILANVTVEEVSNYWGYRIRNAIPIEFDKSHTGCTKFRGVLDNLMEPDDVDMFQYWCGLALLGKNPLHKMMIISGGAGSGKSTIASIVERMIGEDNVATLTSQRLEDRFELSEFFGKTLLVGKDVPAGFLAHKSASVLKSLTGDSNIRAEVKYVQARVRLGSPYNVLIVSNHNLHVRIADDLDAWKRRLWVIPVALKKSFKVDPHFAENLIKKEGAGILYWMLMGARRVLKDMKAGTEYARTATQTANTMSLLSPPDLLKDFCNAHIVPKTGSHVPSELIYDAFCHFCSTRNADAIADTVFYRQIGKHILQKVPTAKGPKTIAATSGTKAYKAYVDIELI